MAKVNTSQIRNVVVVGHSGSGKTTLTEALLYITGAVKRMGKVEEGSTVTDWDDEEHRRQISIHLGVAPLEHDGHLLHLLDTPGYLDFVGEVISGLSVAEAGLVLVDAVAGVEVGTELAWDRLNGMAKPRMVFVNRMDREHANFQRALASLQATFPEGGKILPFQLPIGAAEEFQGVVNLVDMKAYMGPEGTVAEIPEEMREPVEEARSALIDAAAETDDELIMKYLEGEDLTEEEIRRGLGDGVRSGEIVPVFCGSALTQVGLPSLLRALVAYVPAPDQVAVQAVVDGEPGELACDPSGPQVAYVFKTLMDRYVGRINYLRVFSGTLQKDTILRNRRTGKDQKVSNLFKVRGKELIATDELVAGDIGAVTKLEDTRTTDTLSHPEAEIAIPPPEYPRPLYTVAVMPATKADSAKMGQALQSLAEEDPTLVVQYVQATKQTVLQGMGDTHVDVAIQNLQNKYGVKVETGLPKVPYQETITKVATAHYRHKKQTGGAGQFADVHLRVEPLARGEGFAYDSEIFGGAIPSVFIPSIEKGIQQVLEQGVLAGYPIVDVKAVVFDGKYHPVDSKDIAFQIAGREVFKLAFLQAGPTLLEPIYRIEVIVPEEYMGDVMSDLNNRRGRVQGMEQRGKRAIIRALVPLAEILRYGTDLRSMTQGRGVYTIEFDHYEPVPSHLAEQIIAESKREQEAEAV